MGWPCWMTCRAMSPINMATPYKTLFNFENIEIFELQLHVLHQNLAS